MLITLVSAIVMVGVSYLTPAPDYAQIKGLTFGTATAEDNAKTRASWDWHEVAASGFILVLHPGRVPLLPRLGGARRCPRNAMAPARSPPPRSPASCVAARASAADPPAGFTSLFNGRDLSGWEVPAGDNGHWKVLDGVIDYDASSEATGDKALWTQKEYTDFVLRVDWRIKETPYVNPNVPIIRFDGTHKKGPDGKEIHLQVPDSDSGIYLRGSSKSQVNIWCWPIGSGEVYGYRTDEKMPPEVRAGVTPLRNADQRRGRVERVRDHDEGRPADGRPERRSR